MKKLLLAAVLGLSGILGGARVQAQSILNCSCLSTQAVLFTNACAGFIPDLCSVAINCYSSTIVPSPGFTCTQNPPPGTLVTSSTPITFVLTENLTGNSVTCIVTFNVGVSSTPFTALCQPDQFLPCGTTNWAFSPPGWTNTCCTVGMTTNVTIVTNWPVVTATWKIIDGCGVAAQCSQSISFGTRAAPCDCVGIICPPDILIQTCLSPFTSATAVTNITYPLPVTTNYCIGTITNVVCIPPSGSPFPVGTNIVTCTAYDDLGNSKVCHFNIVVLGDTTPPIINCPGPQTNQCGSAWTPIAPTAFDACCGVNVTVRLIGAITNTFAACDDLVVFKWQATDCNGNQALCDSFVHVVDTIPPVITCRGNYTLQCGMPLVPPPATDNCCPHPTVSIKNIVTNGTVPCNYTLTVTWEAQDCCTNTATCTEVVTIVDTTPPVVTCAPNKTVECGNAWDFDAPTALDACCGTNVTVAILNTFTNVFSPCLSLATRKWQVTDCCSNSVMCSQAVTISDTTPPVLTCASNKTVQCGSVWTFDPPAALDACCGTNVTIAVLSTITNNPLLCPGIVTRTWQATDCCGNASTCSQIVTNVDTTPPLITCAGDQTVQCGSPWSFNAPTAFDNCCGTNVAITVASLATNNVAPCHDVIMVTWSAMDCCGNTAFCTNLVNVLDTIPPVITCRTNYIVQCGSPIVPPPATDNCCPTPIVTMLNVVTNSATSCNQSLTVTWQAMDCCTNTATCVEIITIVDTTPPVITCVSNKTVECGSNWTFDSPAALDACCGSNVTVVIVSTVTNTLNQCSKVLTRTWRATDCCSNSATCSQVVSTVDTTPPVLTCPSNLTIAPGIPWTFTSPAALDACCSNSLVLFVLATSTNYNGPNCQMIHSRIWGCYDCCANFTSCTQIVTVQYSSPPANDACSNAQPLLLNNSYMCGETICATASAPGGLSPAPCGNSVNSPDVWYTVVAQCTGPMTVDTCAPCPGQPPFDTVLSAYTGHCPGPLTQVSPTACNDNACGLNSLITFNAVSGQTYLLRVAGASGAVGWFSIQAQQTSPVPTNDLCANAIAVDVGSPAACGTTVCATPSAPGTIPTPCGNSANTPDVWYTYTPQCNGSVTIDTCGTCVGNPQFNTVLSVYTGQCASLTQVACNDDAASGPCVGTPQSLVNFPGIAGVTYYIRVSGAGPNTIGQFRLNVAFVPGPPPPNDLCANATPITAGVYSWNNCNANTDGPFHNGFFCEPSQDVWFKFTAPCAGPVWIHTCGSSILNSMAIYTGGCGNLTLLTCDNGLHGSAQCPGGLASITFAAVAGTTYYIRVGSIVSTVTGPGMLTLIGPNPPLPTCPPTGVCNLSTWRYFRITGLPNCVKWGWCILAPCCVNLQNTNVAAVCAGDENTLAAAFVNSINATAAAAGCGGVSAQAFPAAAPYQGRFGICTSCTGTNAFSLGVGAANVPELAMCFVPNPAGYVAIPVGWCSFNPDIQEIRLSGRDLNNNGIDDAFDIDMGTSQDVNGNGIPDEVEGCLPPVLAAEPVSQSVQTGESATLTVSVQSSTPVNYSWTRNGQPISDGPNVSGASTASLSILAVTANEVGGYSVTATNACGSVTTTPATVSLANPALPVLYDMNLIEGWFHFTVDTRIGYNYLVEYKDRLDDPVWTPLSTIPGAGQPELILDGQPLPQTRFYRVTEKPQP